MIYFKYLKMLVKSSVEYRSSFWMTVFGQFLTPFFGFLGILLLFKKFDSIKGWTLEEVALCYAVVQMGFAITECIARGFDVFSRSIVSGGFDRVLLRPRGTILQIFGSDFQITRVGALIQGIVVFIISIARLEVELDAIKGITLTLMILSAVSVFTGIFIVGATVCFFTVEGLEILNIFTYGGREIAQYPLNIYNRWIVRFFTFIIPFGSFNYLPLLYITDRVSGKEVIYMLMPLLGFLFLFPCVFLWRFGVSRYLSTGS